MARFSFFPAADAQAGEMGWGVGVWGFAASADA
jgi:hypothetical protein